MSFRAGAWIRTECWLPVVSGTTVATDRCVRFCVGSVRRLSTEGTSQVRKAEDDGKVWKVSKRVTDDGRNICPDVSEGRGV